jgi:hypothetical protein
MSKGIRGNRAALAIACIALFAALAGTVYGAATIDGRTILVKSMPGNRLTLGSLPANRLMAGSIPGDRLAPGSITGTQVDAGSLGEVPSAAHADSADTARDAETALNAVNAQSAATFNGHSAGCTSTTRPFAGACWQTDSSETALTATAAARSCAAQGGELPDALGLAAFAAEPQIILATGDEWTGDIPVVSGANQFAVVTVSASAVISSSLSTATKKYRCVIPLVR